MTKRILASIFFCLVVLSLTACNSNIPNDAKQSDATTDDTNNVFTSTDTNSEFTPLDIAESGYTMIEGGFLYCSVKVHNPNTDLAVLYPTVRITARDSSGTLLGTQDQILSTLYPQQDFWYSGQLLQVDTAPSSVDFTIVQPDDYSIVSASTLEHPEFTPLLVVNTAMRSDRLVGEVINKNDFDLDMIVVAAVFSETRTATLSVVNLLLSINSPLLAVSHLICRFILNLQTAIMKYTPMVGRNAYL